MYRIVFAGLMTSIVGLTQITAAQDTPSSKPSGITSFAEAKTPREVRDFITESMKSYEWTMDAEVQATYVEQRAKLSVSGGEWIFEIAKDDTEREAGLRLKLFGLNQLMYAAHLRKDSEAESESGKKRDAFIKELEDDGKFLIVVNDEKYQAFLSGSIDELQKEFTQEKFDRFVNGSKQWSNTKPLKIGPVSIFLAVVKEASSPKAQEFNPKLVEKTVNELLAFVKSDESTLTEDQKKDVVLQVEGFARRSVGADPRLYGKTLNDKDFDWKSLRGKYVIVKFTASWCGPCKGEIPGLKKAYENYHDKGLEIVSVYVWDKLEDSKKSVETEHLPWITLSEELTEKAGQSPQGKAYGISGVPTMFLVDQEGKVLLIEARGERLQKKLAELFAKKEETKTITASLIVPNP